MSVAAVIAALAGSPAALADTSPSANWSGYAAHGVTFQQVSARWQQPRAKCMRGNRTYSAIWVGLGGYSLNAPALEQTGTELDCTASGKVVSSAWYELVPWPSHMVSLKVRPGDQMSASVEASGSTITVTLSNLSTHRSFKKIFHPRTIDVTSAEWIVEAPSACVIGATNCQTLPLTNFGKATFNHARAKALAGPVGTISNGPWTYTEITLVPGAQTFVIDNPGGVSTGSASPSSLNPYGGSFSVTYRPLTSVARPRLSQRLPAGPVYIRH